MNYISIILPVYNASDYLRETLESITAQTYKNFEIIAINDGSSDNSLEILENYALNEPRLHIISRENKGLPQTLNEGIDLAKGDFIARMDADDIMLPQRLEKQLEYLLKNKLDLCGTQYQEFGLYSGKSDLPISEDDCKLTLLFGSPFSHPSIFARTEVFKNFKYNENLDCAQDYDLWCRIALSNYKLGNMKDVLLKYRISSNQISLKKREKQRKNTVYSAKRYWQNYELTKDITFYDFIRSRFLDDDRKFIKSIISLNLIINKLNNIERIKIVKDQKYRLMLIGSKLGLKPNIMLLKHSKEFNLKEKIIILLSSLFKASLISDLIKKNTYLNWIVCKLLNYS